MEKKKRFPVAVLVIAVILIAGGLLIGPSLLAGRKTIAQTEAKEAPVFSVRTEEAKKQTLRAYLDINGDIVVTQQVDVFPDAAGKLISLRVSLGSIVSRGQVIAEIDPSRPGMTYENSPVYAPISGTITRTPLSTGSTVSSNTVITTISGSSNLEINARIPEREIAGLNIGMKADASLQAYPGETFTATVTRISPVVDSASRTKQISLLFDREDNRINAGMFARLKINTRTYPSVLTIPAEAVVNSRGVDTVVVISSDNTAETREVSCGVTLQGLTEIKSGISEGETVIVQGQQLLRGGETVRVIGGGTPKGL